MSINLIRTGLFILLLLSNSFLFGVENFHTSTNTVFENITPRLLQKTTSLHSIKIVVPDEPEWKILANGLQHIIKEKTNLIAEISYPDQMKFVNE